VLSSGAGAAGPRPARRRTPFGWLTATLGVLLAALSAAAVVACWQQTKIVAEVAKASNDADTYQQAAYQGAREMALIEAALTDPRGAQRRLVPTANQQVNVALARMAATDAGDRGQARVLAQEHLNLGPEIELYLLELDRDQHLAARHTLETAVEPSYDRITAGLLDAQRRHLAESERREATAQRVSRHLLWGSALLFLVGLAALWLSGWSIRAHRRTVESLARTDALTRLPNRRAFTAGTQEVLTRAPAHPAEPAAALLLVDLDGFRTVNDQFGHGIGDLLLIEAGRRLTRTARAGDLVARLGGDEFGVLMAHAGPEAAEAFAARLAEAFTAPFAIGELTLDLEISIGAAGARPGDDATALMRRADTALHTAKRDHTGFHDFTVGDADDTSARIHLLGDLRRALDDPGQILLHYQPQIDLRTGEMAGVEALARWQHPVRGMISPGDFIPVLEGTSLIHRFTEVVLMRALSQAQAWLSTGFRVPVSVNISSRSLLGMPLCDRVATLLKETGLPGEMLCIEITEHTLMQDPLTAIEALHRIRALGVRTSIDDYGTGYSSMTYLKTLPVDELKIDRSFVGDMTADPRSHALVASTIDLGHNLGLTVVAEGVEDEATAEALRDLGCDSAQGYHFARPMPADAVAEQIRA
jgi:diguanylate cyclase (GGDEF)-like protein